MPYEEFKEVLEEKMLFSNYLLAEQCFVNQNYQSMPVPNANKDFDNLQFDDLDGNFYFHLEDLQVKLFEEI